MSYRDVPQFNPGELTGGPASNLGSAAGVVNLGNTYGSLVRNKPDYASISATAVANRAQERATILGIEGDINAAGISAMGNIKSSELIADAQKSAAKSAAQGSKMGSIFSAVGTAGGLLMGLSDESTKDNVKAIDDALETLRQLRPVTFNYKPEWSMSPERTHHGFIAQEYKEVMPDASYYDEEYQKHCIDTNDLIGLLVRAIQQLETRVARMEKALVGAN